MNILIACEFSGTVRRAFRRLGLNAFSCDILPSDDNSKYHIQTDVISILDFGWDMMIAHPPCKFIALCQAWRKKPSREDAKAYGLDINDIVWRMEQREKAIKFAKVLWNASIPKIAIENPKSLLSTRMEPKSQTIHPWQFGHGETKETWLWLKGLHKLTPTNIVDGRENRIWKMPPSETRWKDRSVTYSGIAEAMAFQWGLNL